MKKLNCSVDSLGNLLENEDSFFMKSTTSRLLQTMQGHESAKMDKLDYYQNNIVLLQIDGDHLKHAMVCAAQQCLSYEMRMIRMFPYLETYTRKTLKRFL